jgi:hypothetical protein
MPLVLRETPLNAISIQGNPPQCHYSNHKSHMFWPRIEARSLSEILHDLQMRETRNNYKILSTIPVKEGTIKRLFFWALRFVER